MSKTKAIKALKDRDFRNSLEDTSVNPSAGIVDLDDDALQTISGGCSCQFTTVLTSCVPPGVACP